MDWKYSFKGVLLKNKMIQIISGLIIGSAFLYPQVVVTTGVAFPLSKSEKGNAEMLFDRALSNAKKEAISLVLGERVIAERVDESKQKEITAYDGTKDNESLKQQRSSRKSVTALSKGYVQLIKMIDKGFKSDGHYYVKAKFDITKNPNNTLKIGQYWIDAGSPSVGLFVSEKINGKNSKSEVEHSYKYFVENFNKNDIEISKNEDNQYKIKILQFFTQEQNVELGTFATNCRLSFDIIDTQEIRHIKTFHVNNGPTPSFSEKEGRLKCLSEITQNFSKILIRNFVEAVNYKSLNGSMFQITINNLSGEKLLHVTELFRKIFQVKNTQIKIFENNRVQLNLNFTGNRQTLLEAIISSFEMEEIILVPVKLIGNKISFTIKEEKT